MVFRSLWTTVYQIRRNEEVREVIPSDYVGVLTTDRGRSYDAKALAKVAQQKWLSHLLRSLRAMRVTKHGRGRSFTKEVKQPLTAALELWRQQRAGCRPSRRA